MQLNTLSRWLEAISAMPWYYSMRKILNPVYDRMTSTVLTPAGAGLVISGASAATAKTGGSDTYCLANGVFLKVASGTVLPALAGTILQNNFGGWVFFIDQGGTITALFMNQATTLAGLTFPQFPPGKATLGFVFLNPTTAAFIGGTTFLDAANTNAIYISTTEGFDPWCLVGGPVGAS